MSSPLHECKALLTTVWRRFWTETRKFVGYADIFLKIFQKMSSPPRNWIFYEFLAIYPPALFVSFLQIQQTKNTLNHRNFTKSYRCSIESLKTTGKWRRPVAESCETGTRKNGSWDRDKSRESNTVMRNYHD